MTEKQVNTCNDKMKMAIDLAFQLVCFSSNEDRKIRNTVGSTPATQGSSYITMHLITLERLLREIDYNAKNE